MKKQRASFFFVIVILLTCLIVCLIYASLLGENRKIADTVTDFFSKIKEMEYDEVCEKLALSPQQKDLSDKDCAELCFLLELALLQRYELLDKDDYDVELESSPFWIPFLRDGPVTVDIALREKADSFFALFFSAKDQRAFIKRLMTLERINGFWRITGIDVSSTDIAPTFAKLESELQLDHYLTYTTDGFTMDQLRVNTDEILLVDKRSLKFILHKAQTLIDKSKGSSLFSVGDLKDPTSLAVKLRDASNPLSLFLQKQFSLNTQQLLNEYNDSSPPPESLQSVLIQELNQLLQGPSFYDEDRFAHVTLSQKTQQLIKQSSEGQNLIRLNRLLLEEAYPHEIAKSQSEDHK